MGVKKRAMIVLTIIFFLNVSIGGKDSMNILCITHEDFETPGVIQEWAERNQHNFNVCKPYAGENCLNKDDFDFLIIMGGSQSARDYVVVPYLNDEVNLIRKAIENNKRIIGFCLGAQLIGEALGAKTEKSPEKEIGVYPITLTEQTINDPLLKYFSENLLAIHWHNDMPGITSSAQVFGYSAGCPRQIIKYGERVYGFQCHLEITKEGIETMIQHCPEDLVPSAYTQSIEEMLKQDYESINQAMFRILDSLSALQ